MSVLDCALSSGRILTIGLRRVAVGALYVDSQGSQPVEFPQVQFLDEVVFMPVACRQFWGPDVQKTVIFHSCSLGQVVDVLARAVHRRLWMACAYATTSGLLLEVPQLSSSPGLVDFPGSETVGFFEGWWR